MMANYTGEQIKKAVECCFYATVQRDLEACEFCPLQGIGCTNLLIECAFDLINRYEAEIAELKEQNATLEKMYMSFLPTPQTATSEHERASREDILCREIERLRKSNEELATESDARDIDETWIIARAKSEARKELVERLKRHCEVLASDDWNKITSPSSWAGAYECFVDDINNVVKEIEGEGE